MIRIVHAELLRLVRRRTVLIATSAALLFAVVATTTGFASAEAAGAPSRRTGTTLAALAEAGGGTQTFAVGASFVGFLVFVTFIALMAGEFAGGTFRAMLLREPRRLRVIVGKLAGALILAAVLIAVAEAACFALSLLLAPGEGISTSPWFSAEALRAGIRDYATVLGGVTGWAIFGTTLAVVFRSVPVALAVGFAWAGPFENITVDSWEDGYRVFPGQVLASLIRGGTVELAMGRAVLTAALYAGIAAVVSLVLVSRRDVTG